MYDRNEYDLRFAEHKQRTDAINGQGWKETVILPMPAPRRFLATLLRGVAVRLDPTLAATPTDTPPPILATS